MNLPPSPAHYPDFLRAVEAGPNRRDAHRWLCRNDLFYLVRYVLGGEPAEHPWIFERCREVQDEPDGFLDLWAREHWKTTIITVGLTIQDILKSHGEHSTGEEITVGLFSHTRPVAKSFLAKIKREFESNLILKTLFPDVLYERPQSQSPRWSLDEGLIVMRRSNPPEGTIEASGLVDGQPTGRHYHLLLYDDVVTLASVTTPEQIQKTTEALALSYNLGRRGGRRRMIGTRYHANDTYREVIERGTFQPRIYPCTHDGTVDGDPVLFSRDEIAEKYRDQGPYVFACQQLLSPTAAGNQGFQESWLRYWLPEGWDAMNRYLVVDPAHSKKRGSDYTSMWVVGLGTDENYYVIDGVYDRLSLAERTQALFDLHWKYRPRAVGYEQYGMQADIAHIEEMQRQRNHRFAVTPLGGAMPKFDRIRRLQPLFAAGRVFLPSVLTKVSTDGEVVDIIKKFVREEYLPFPVSVHDDGLDCLARVLDADLKTLFPVPMHISAWALEPQPEAAY